jgi:hypothetical protein
MMMCFGAAASSATNLRDYCMLEQCVRTFSMLWQCARLLAFVLQQFGLNGDGMMEAMMMHV